MEHSTAYKFGQVVGNLVFAISIALIIGFAIVYWRFAIGILLGGIVVALICRRYVEVHFNANDEK